MSIGKNRNRRSIRNPAPADDPEAFADRLLEWFAGVRRDYPWRRTGDPYAILVSEMMLQQTQVATVLERGYYLRWMERFPDCATLAAASGEEVLRYWEGLGYYNRARNLQAAARRILDEHQGRFPRDPEAILALPGVGRYTAGAVASIAFGLPEPAVDANIGRVLARLFDFRDPIDVTAGQRQLWDWAAELLPAREPGAFNSALMELGQSHCRAGVDPDCAHCPVAGFCTTDDPRPLPVKRPPKKTVTLDEPVFLLLRNGRVFLEMGAESRRRGFWKLPAMAEDHLDSNRWEEIGRRKYSITHHRVTLIVHAPPPEFTPDPDPARRWFGIDPGASDGVDSIPMASPHRRALEKFRAHFP